jgi:diacylglycerol kinase (ATP)
MDLVKAVMVLNNHTIKKADTWKLNEETFLNVAGTGFDAYITQVFATHGKRGLSTYARLVFREFNEYKAQSYSLVFDDDIRVETKAFLISIANGSQYGNNAFVNRKANVSDGMVEICILQQFPLYAAAGIAFKMFTGSLSTSKYTINYRAKDLTIEQSAPFAHLDGDPVKSGTKLSIRCLPLSLNVIVPHHSQL